MRDIHANLACVRSNTNFRKTKMLKPKQLHLALVPLMLNPNRPSRFDLHRHFFGIYRSSLRLTKQLIWVHMDQAAFGILSSNAQFAVARDETTELGGFRALVQLHLRPAALCRSRSQLQRAAAAAALSRSPHAAQRTSHG